MGTAQHYTAQSGTHIGAGLSQCLCSATDRASAESTDARGSSLTTKRMSMVWLLWGLPLEMFAPPLFTHPQEGFMRATSSPIAQKTQLGSWELAPCSETDSWPGRARGLCEVSLAPALCCPSCTCTQLWVGQERGSEPLTTTKCADWSWDSSAGCLWVGKSLVGHRFAAVMQRQWLPGSAVLPPSFPLQGYESSSPWCPQVPWTPEEGFGSPALPCE